MAGGPRHAHALRDAEAPAPAARPAHGRLGARGGAAAGAEPRRRRRLAGDARTRSARSRSPCRSVPLGTGDAVARRARARSTAPTDDVLVLSGDTPLLTPELLARARRGAPPRGGAAATVLSFEPARPRAVRTPRPRRRRPPCARSSRPATRRRRARVREFNSSIYVFRGRALWPALDRLEPRERAGRALPDRRGRDLVEGGEPRRAPTSRPTPPRRRASTRASSSPPPPRSCATASTRRTCSPASTIVDPAVDVDRGGRRARAGLPSCTRSPSSAAATRIAAGAEVGPHAVAIDAEIGAGAIVGPFCYLRPGRSSRQVRRPARSSRSRTRTSERARRCRISPTSATPRSARTRTSPRATITANFPHEPGRPKGRTTIGRNVRTGVHNTFVAPVDDRRRCVDCGRDRSSPRTFPPTRSRHRSRRARSTRKGYAAWKAETTELALPGLEVPTPRPRACSRATGSSAAPQKRLMVVRGPLAPGARRSRSRSSSASSSARSSWRRSRTARRTAATASRSAAPTSSSSRRAAPPVDREPDGAAADDPGGEARLGQADHRRHAAGSRTRARTARRSRASRSRPASSPTCSSSPAPTAC